MTKKKDLNNLVWVSDVYLGRRFSVARQTIWAWIRSQNFPHPKKLSPGCTRWRMADILEWESQQIEEEGSS